MLEFEKALARAVVLFEDLSAYDVAGHEIGRELDATEVQSRGRGEGPNQTRLAESRRSLHEDVATGHDRGEQIVHQTLLAKDDPGHCVTKRGENLHAVTEVGRWTGVVGGSGTFERHVAVGYQPSPARLGVMELRHGRVHLRPIAALERGEWQRLARHFRDPDIAHLNGTPPSRLPAWMLRRLLRADAARRDRASFGIFDEHDAYVGTAELYDVRGDEATLGIIIGERTHWNKGYGPEAIHALLHLAFRTWGLRRVNLTTFDDNVRAQRAFAKVGFREVRRTPARDGRSDVHMTIGRDAWVDGPANGDGRRERGTDLA